MENSIELIKAKLGVLELTRKQIVLPDYNASPLSVTLHVPPLRHLQDPSSFKQLPRLIENYELFVNLEDPFAHIIKVFK